jgi:16S rRNA (cytidine1402-2'-O)-methyltransferase
MLTLIPTPIGNLGDVSFRTIDVLKEGEILLCEDTRVSKKLLSLLSEKYSVTFPKFEFISIHSHNEKHFIQNEDNIHLLKEKNCIYMSDAGMPCVSDPGAVLVQTCIEKDVEYDVIPGANAILTAYAMSGFTNTSFSFYGFLPHKSENRYNQLYQIMHTQTLSIVYESPHRLLKLLEQIKNIDPNREVFIAKEMSKKYQTFLKNSADKLFYTLKDTSIKGEWVVIIQRDETQIKKGSLTEDDILPLDIPPKQKAKLLSKLTGKTIKTIYGELTNK